MVTTRPAGQSYIIMRPRLTKLLDESQARIILLCAPAGYGKTTLAREWIATRSEPVAWYRGGPEMLDVAAVARGMAVTLEAVVSRRDLGRRIEALAGHNQDPLTLGRALASAVTQDGAGILVIDDYQFATDAPDSETLVATLAASSPLRILVTSRSRPAWLESRMAVYGEAVVLGHRELAFTDEEARSVVAEAPEEEREATIANARGWPAIIGLSVFHRDARSLIARSSLPAELYEYFAEALLSEASPKLQEALYALVLCGDRVAVASEVLATDMTSLINEAFERGFVTNTPTAVVDLHPLLRQFLLRKFRETRSASDPLVVACFAALGSAQLWDECLTLLTEFPEATTLAEQLGAALADLLATGRVATVRRWLELAHGIQARDSIFLLAEAELALREGRDTPAQALAENAAKGLRHGDLAAQAFIVAGRASHLRGENESAKQFVRRARNIAKTPAVAIDATWLLFLTAVEEQDPAVHRLADELRNAADTSPTHALRVQNAEAFLDIEIAGRTRHAIATMERAQGLLDHVYDPLVRSTFMNLWSNCTLCVGNYERVLELTDRQLEDARSSGLDFAADYALVTRAGALIGLRRLGEAQKLLKQLASKAVDASGHLAAQIGLKTARLRAASGDFGRAQMVLRPDPPSGVSRAFSGEWFGNRAVLLAASPDIDGAKHAMKEAWARSAEGDGKHLADLARVILLLREIGDAAPTAPVTLLRRVVGDGHLDDVVFASRVCTDIARLAATDSYLRDELTRLLMNSHDVDLGRAAGLEMPRELRRQEGLTPREQDVFELLAQGRSNKDIARTLFISESTTKVHVQHIFEKLGVHSRAEAVAAKSNGDTTR